MPDADVPKKAHSPPLLFYENGAQNQEAQNRGFRQSSEGIQKGRHALIDASSIPKLIMFLYGFLDVPSATHTLWKDDKVSFTKRYRLTVCGRYCYLAFNNQTGFFVVIVPRKHRRLLAPDGPRPATKFVDRFHRGIFCYFNLHRKKVFCSIKGIYERTLYTNENKMLPTLHVVRHVVSHVSAQLFSQVSTFWQRDHVLPCPARGRQRNVLESNRVFDVPCLNPPEAHEPLPDERTVNQYPPKFCQTIRRTLVRPALRHAKQSSCSLRQRRVR